MRISQSNAEGSMLSAIPIPDDHIPPILTGSSDPVCADDSRVAYNKSLLETSDTSLFEKGNTGAAPVLTQDDDLSVKNSEIVLGNKSKSLDKKSPSRSKSEVNVLFLVYFIFKFSMNF